MITKGIVLAGGAGTRLHPITQVISKQLLPVYDKPMIFYPISTLMLAGIRNILIISTPSDLPLYERLLGSGKAWGVQFEYAVQEKPGGIAQAFLVGEKFLGQDRVCLILGDNIFYGRMDLIREAISCGTGAIVFAYRVRHPERYGVIEFDRHEQPIRIVEKPQNPPSSYVVTGLYMYGPEVVNIVKTCRPSARGELEITSVNNAYLKKNELKVVKFTRGVAWLDTGTHGSLLDASNFVEALDSRQALKLSCLEEIAYRMQYIDREGLRRLIKEYQECDYKQYLKRILEENDAQ